MPLLCVRFYAQEGLRHAGQPIHEWLFEAARALGIPGGTAFRASAGFGRHGLHEDSFFELAGSLPETVEFFADEAAIQALLRRVGEAGLRLVYMTYPVSTGVTG
jgi:hypothetical protein